MKIPYFDISSIPVVLLGAPSDKIFLFVHGQGGNKEDARTFAEVAETMGWQVLGVDLPKHGVRINDALDFTPWQCVLELRQVMAYVKAHWNQVAVRANSIGCYFTLLAFSNEPLVRCLMVSPLVDMERMIVNLMHWSGVTEERLEQEKNIETEFGQTLSWEYLCYVRRHPMNRWDVPTFNLRSKKDELIDEDTVIAFSNAYGCKLTMIEEGGHWLHTPEELLELSKWEKEILSSYLLDG